MARKLKGDEKVAAPANVSHGANLIGYDPQQLKTDVATIIDMLDKAREDAAPIKEKKDWLKAERGYHMGGFGVCLQLDRKDPVEARDMWRTIKAYAEARGLDDPDLVDKMEGAV
jgi:hypothetical protein